MINDKEIIIYWSPASFIAENETWNMLYQEPKNLFANLIAKNVGKGIMTTCPSTKNLMKNTFSINSTIEDRHEFYPGILEEVANNEIEEIWLNTGGKIGLRKARKASIEGYVNINYNLSWLFYASEPVEMKLTAPYYPAISPVQDALFSPGSYDVGRWYRHANLDWHIPINSKEFVLEEDTPLMYLEFNTDKKITFQRYEANAKLHNIALEHIESPKRYGRFLSLEKRYKLAEKTGLRNLIMNEIQKCLV